jgi:hypothetical protein
LSLQQRRPLVGIHMTPGNNHDALVNACLLHQRVAIQFDERTTRSSEASLSAFSISGVSWSLLAMRLVSRDILGRSGPSSVNAQRTASSRNVTNPFWPGLSGEGCSSSRTYEMNISVTVTPNFLWLSTVKKLLKYVILPGSS